MTRIEAERKEALAEAAEIIRNRLARAIAQRGSAVLGIPGGRSVQTLFGILSTASLNWHRVHVFFVDERCVPLDSEDSNYRLAEEHLFRPLQARGRIGNGNIHPFLWDPDRPQQSVTAYDRALHTVAPTLRFDVAVLGVGEDGHIASLFPSHSVLEQQHEGYVLVDNAPKPPPRRITVTAPVLRRARSAVGLFLGEGKRDALQAFDAERSVEVCPAALLREVEEAFVVTDQAS